MFFYNKKFDEDNWDRLIKNGKKYGHQFPSSYLISDSDIVRAKERVVEYQLLWDKYDDIFRDKIPIIYKHNFPRNCTFFVNTSPYSSFNVEKKYLSISMMREENRFIPTMIHEASHFLFQKYYIEFCYSIGCSYEEIDKIKEFITIITNDVFSPMQDVGWNDHEKYRKEALKIWKDRRNLKDVIQHLKNMLDKNIK